jgi:hypothetical protein
LPGQTPTRILPNSYAFRHARCASNAHPRFAAARKLPLQEFAFQREKSGDSKGDLGIVNLHPQEAEAAFFLPTAVNLPPDTDYAIVSIEYQSLGIVNP